MTHDETYEIEVSGLRDHDVRIRPGESHRRPFCLQPCNESEFLKKH